jgi:hypothetical protein
MKAKTLLQQLSELPPAVQQEAFDFIALIILKYQKTQPCPVSTKPRSLKDEPFIGMWKDREDMQDSGAWVRAVRHQY